MFNICKFCYSKFKPRNRNKKDSNKYCSRICAFLDWHNWNPTFKNIKHYPNKCCKIYFKKCYICKNKFICRNKKTKVCSNECKRKYLLIKQSEYKFYKRNKDKIYRCKICNKKFNVKWKYKTGKSFQFCSKKCQNINIKIHKKLNENKRKILKRNVEYNTINNIEIFKRDKYKCYICKLKLNKNNKVPHPLAPTIDHIIPLSKGGSHTAKNIKTCCFRCNCIKSDKYILKLFDNNHNGYIKIIQ